MKKIIKKTIFSFILIIALFAIIQYQAFAGCGYNGTGDILNALDGCLNGTEGLIAPASGNGIEGNIEGFKKRVIVWSNTLAGFFALGAVGALVYGSFQLVFSTGNDEKVNSAKKTIKWALMGFIGILLAAGIVRILIELIYTYAG